MKKEYLNSYAVFCMAMAIDSQNKIDLDLLWEIAIKNYEKFIISKFNDVNKSELDCINEYVKNNNF